MKHGKSIREFTEMENQLAYLKRYVKRYSISVIKKIQIKATMRKHFLKSIRSERKQISVDYDIKAVEEEASLYFAGRNTNLYSNCGEQFDIIYKN